MAKAFSCHIQKNQADGYKPDDFAVTFMLFLRFSCVAF
jgi:hypothetical protein